jgi:hypothetical protein
MEEMVEPDRTIMIVSIIGLVIIWGSFFYHKYVQDNGQQGTEPASASSQTSNQASAPPSAEAQAAAGREGQRKGRKKGRKK